MSIVIISFFFQCVICVLRAADLHPYRGWAQMSYSTRGQSPNTAPASVCDSDESIGDVEGPGFVEDDERAAHKLLQPIAQKHTDSFWN